MYKMLIYPVNNMTNIKQTHIVRSSSWKKCAVCGLYKSGNISMHKSPINIETRKLWSEAIGKELLSSSLICSNHFKPSDYKANMSNRLKSGAVPSKFNSNYSIVQSQTISKSVISLDSYSSNENIDDTNSEIHLSDQNTEDSNSQEEEQCYIYYLDEEQNVSVFESGASNSNKSNEPVSPLNTEINQEDSLSNMDIDMTQFTTDSCTEAKSLEVSTSQCLTVLQNLSLQPFIGLNSSHFTSKVAWQTFCDVISAYRGKIYDLQDHNNILQIKINHLKELLNIHITKI